MVKKEEIIIGADHAGYATKEKIKKFLEKKGIWFVDIGTYSKKSVDYPDIAKKVTDQVKKDKNKRGVLVCGTGTGMAMAANRVKGIRAAMAYDTYSAKMAKQDNNANVLCLRGRKFSSDNAVKLVQTWMKTEFNKEVRYKRRLKKLDAGKT